MNQPQGQRPAPSGGAAVFQKMRAIGKKVGEAEEFDRILERMKEARSGHPSIVMVGEISRGKSTIVNALIGQPGLAPVDAQETTALVVNFAPTTPKAPAGTCVLEYEREPQERPIPLQELSSWVTVDGKRLNEADEMPRQATVHVDSWLLPKVIIVDTPGTGGLSEDYARRAFDRAERASVLVLVTDAGGRISSHALEFLKACADKVAEVVIVENKIDAHRGTWQSILDEDRQIVAEAVPALAKAPFVGISARWAEQAAREPGAGRRQKLLEQSRIEEFTAVIRSILARADEIPAQNALRQAQAALRPHLESKVAERAALRSVDEGGGQESAADVELMKAKEKREELLLTFDDSKYDWPAAIEDVRGELQMETNARCRHFQNRWKERVENEWSKLSKQRVLQMQNELDASLEVHMTEQITRTVHRTGGLVRWLYGQAGMTPTPELLAQFGARRNQWRGQRHEQYERKGQAMELRGMLGSAMMGMSVTRIALMSAGAIAMPAALGIAVVMGGHALWSGGRKANKQAVIQVIGDRTTEMREHLDRFNRQCLSLVQTEAKKQFDRDLKKSVNAAKEEVQKLQQAKSATAEERKRRLQILEPQIAELRSLFDDADRELSKLQTAKRG